jgi:hypothetical protein
MTTFWSMPCRKDGLRYRRGWMVATGELWRTKKEVRGSYRRITRWFMAHHKKVHPNPNKKRDEARWRKMGYE